MKATEIVSTLQTRGINLWQESRTLRYRAPTGALTDKERAEKRGQRAVSVTWLERSFAEHTPGYAAVNIL